MLSPEILAGFCVGWSETLTFPLDTVRSRVMADKMTFGKAWTAKGLWKGYSIAATRAVVNAVSFSVYEQALLNMNK